MVLIGLVVITCIILGGYILTKPKDRIYDYKEMLSIIYNNCDGDGYITKERLVVLLDVAPSKLKAALEYLNTRKFILDADDRYFLTEFGKNYYENVILK